MLKLILGRAKSGKTAAIMDEISALALEGRGGVVLLVPEQYSHEAETELLRRCGDSLSLYAEVLSFTRLCSRVEEELGRPAGTPLDKAGRLLCMALAVDAVGSRLKIYGAARRQPPLQAQLLAAVDTLKTACVSPDALGAFAAPRTDASGQKLRELAIIYEAYESVLAQGRLDPADRLARLAGCIARSDLARARFFLDGFTDFTRVEREVIRSLLSAGAHVTVCLTCQGLEENHEIFQSSRRAALSLRRIAGELDVPCTVEQTAPRSDGGAMAFLERELFGFAPVRADAGGAVRLYAAGSLSEECELAAATCAALARETGCRWRDIAVAARSFDSCRAALENAFGRFGVPLYTAAKDPVSRQPLYTLISSAYEIVTGGWEYEDMFSYLRTGLAGLTGQECDELDDYAFTWSVKGAAWTRGDWKMHPEGYGGQYDGDALARLERINTLRRRAAAPLAQFDRAVKQAGTALGQAAALAALFDALDLPSALSRRAGELRQLGMERQAAEYAQLWELAVSALEQCAGILSETPADAAAFGRLYCLALSRYELGTIPMSLDAVSAGGMDRMRRRNIKHLIVIGCDGSQLPLISPGEGIFSEEDISALLAGGIDVGGGAADRLEHEFALMYNCLTLPSQTLHMSCCATDDAGSAAPSFVMTRASEIFGVPIAAPDMERCRLLSEETALELAAGSAAGRGGALGAACAQWFAASGRDERLRAVSTAASLGRGRLSPGAVRALYGETPRLSATRIDRLSACRFAYFLQYGLRAKPRQAASFSPPEFGVFMHYILENVCAEINGLGGFGAVGDEAVEKLCSKYVESFVHDRLNDFSEKSARFVYLFRRLTGTVRTVVADMVRELRRSDFRPVDFELDFGKDLPPLRVGEGGGAITLTGVADRVDGYVHDGKLYLRVVDYKTGWKKFSLSDVWYGMGLQMLLYMFALQRAGRARYGREVEGAGVLYVPARDALVRADASLTDEQLDAERAKALRRSGLLLDKPEILRAMERGDTPRYLPVSVKSGVYGGGSLASAERLGQLSRHIDGTIRSLAGELRRGSVAADPYFRSQTDTACRFCDYRAACHFDEDTDRRRYMPKLGAAEVWERLEQNQRKEDRGNEP